MQTAAALSTIRQELLRRSRRLYSPPAVALRVLQLADDPRLDLPALQKCIESDPALAGKILRVVNSSLFGLSRPVGDLKQALALLGAQPLKLLVLGFSLPKTLSEGVEAELLETFWRKATVKGAACREISRRFYRQEGDEALIAGLTANLGMLVLIQELDPSYCRFASGLQNSARELERVELESLGFHHRQLSGELLSQWNLPAHLSAAVAAPLQAEEVCALAEPVRSLAQQLHLAELLWQVLAGQGPESFAELLEAAALYCGATYLDIEQLSIDVEDHTVELAEAFQWNAQSKLDCGSLVRQAHALLAEETEILLQRKTGVVRGEQRFSLVSRPELKEDVISQETTVPPEENHPFPGGQEGLLFRRQFADFLSGCRRRRVPCTLMLLQLDDVCHLLASQGPERLENLIVELPPVLAGEIDLPHASQRVADFRLAVIVEDCDRLPGLRLARELRETAARFSQTLLSAAVTFSLGMATMTSVPKNADAESLQAAAQRCLHAALRAGNQLKSIEIF